MMHVNMQNVDGTQCKLLLLPHPLHLPQCLPENIRDGSGERRPRHVCGLMLTKSSNGWTSDTSVGSTEWIKMSSATCYTSLRTIFLRLGRIGNEVPPQMEKLHTPLGSVWRYVLLRAVIRWILPTTME